MNGMNHFWGMGWIWIIGLAIVIAVIWIIVKALNQNSGSNRTGKSPLDILNERYARGEINKEEYEQKRKDIV